MAQPHGRGHASYTYEVKSVVGVDHDRLTVTITAKHSVAPVTHGLSTAQSEVPLAERPPIVRQVFQACIDSIEVEGRAGRWSSDRTVSRSLGFAGRLVDEFIRGGVQKLESSELDLPQIRRVLSRMPLNATRRTLTWVLARAIESTNRPDARTIALRLRNTSFPTDERGERNPYSDAELEVLRAAAQAVLDDIYESHRVIFDSLRFDTSSRAWRNVMAKSAIAAAKVRDALRPVPLQGTSLPQGRLSWDDDEVIDWLLLNPTGVPTSAPAIGAQGPRFAQLLHGVYFPE